ncbi:hypothetical protein BO71DRAFT_195065 [Aspergillus ellipticus CBS 707.79]|uniref:Uncharacterized protein n=1 Tax=Aspergillus ellipticus CBS 707.79 TaxID=1448320 RepID=A0A319DEL3_9EURO|nr:hypothetical protein BO71DRAFT_195065 [Aspergillus ellipticus CBS 707.79]
MLSIHHAPHLLPTSSTRVWDAAGPAALPTVSICIRYERDLRYMARFPHGGSSRSTGGHSIPPHTTRRQAVGRSPNTPPENSIGLPPRPARPVTPPLSSSSSGIPVAGAVGSAQAPRGAEEEAGRGQIVVKEQVEEVKETEQSWRYQGSSTVAFCAVSCVKA